MSEKYLYNSVNTSEYKMWMAFPAIYSFSMASLGYLWMFKTIDEVEDISIERVCSDTEKTQFRPDEVSLIAFSFKVFPFSSTNSGSPAKTMNLSL